MHTRASNANKHPGEVQLRHSSRRPKEVVQAERTAKATEKEKVATAKATAIQKLAQLEYDAQVAKRDGHPVAKALPRRNLRRKAKVASEGGIGKTLTLIKHKHSTCSR
jgi:hypothetical protein